MPNVSPEKIRTPAGSDNYALTNDLRLMGESSRTFVPVANTTERAAVAAAMLAAGRPVSATNPLVVMRADAAPGTQAEFSMDGTTWQKLGGERMIRGLTLVTTNSNGDFSIVHNGGFTAGQVIMLQDFGNASGSGFGPILFKPNWSAASTADTIVARAFSPAPGTPAMASISTLVGWLVVGATL